MMIIYDRSFARWYVGMVLVLAGSDYPDAMAKGMDSPEEHRPIAGVHEPTDHALLLAA